VRNLFNQRYHTFSAFNLSDPRTFVPGDAAYGGLRATLQMFERLKSWARSLKRDVHALYLAARDPRVPWYVKALAIGIAAYALSPIDLIPDFIPVLGYLDELIILPLAIMLVVRLIAPEVMAEHRTAAAAASIRPKSKTGAAFVIAVWIVLASMTAWMVYVRLA
jgi:uncharacterized membrane protein YkvA (DUF1232 family)